MALYSVAIVHSAHPSYISLDVPEPMAALIASWRAAFDPDFAHLPVEIALAGSSGLGVLSRQNDARDVVKVIERLATASFPIVTRFTASTWLDDLKVYALEVESVVPLLHLHEALARSGLAFEPGVPPVFHPHCALRWTQQWMNETQMRQWSRVSPPRDEFTLRDLVLYQLSPGAGNAVPLLRTTLGG
jgi:hypothetical protein